MKGRWLEFRPKEDGVGGKVTHLAIAAHMDDIEIMAVDGILKAQANPEVRFAGVVVTDSRGAPRKGEFAEVTDEEMAEIRIGEQTRAAALGNYTACVLMGYPSAAVKMANNEELIRDLAEVIEHFGPEVVYTHSLADKHPTHAAVCLRVIETLRRIPEKKVKEFIGCEVWRGLDWLPDDEKVLMDVSENPDLQKALLQAHRSQTVGGKNYLEAVMGRRAANATFLNPHDTDRASGLVYGMDLMPLLEDVRLDPLEYVRALTSRFQDEVLEMIRGLR